MTIEKNPDETFLSRWARVKEFRQASESSVGEIMPSTSIGEPLEHKMPEEDLPEPTLPDVPVVLPSLDSLTPQSDFSPFMAHDVDPHLRNLAMKKLFTDPHYNVMDRLDTYIDDYSTHPPLSPEVIRQMSISKTLRLFDDDEEAKEKDVADKATAPIAALTEAAKSEPLPAADKPVTKVLAEPTASAAVKPPEV